MIIYKHYAIYVEVPSGYPGVEAFWSYDRDVEAIKEYAKRFRPYAIIDILEAN